MTEIQLQEPPEQQLPALIAQPPRHPHFTKLMSFLPPQAARLEERIVVTASRIQVLVSSMSIRYKIAAALVMVLCDKLNGLGPASALELLSKLGTFIARGGKR